MQRKPKRQLFCKACFRIDREAAKLTWTFADDQPIAAATPRPATVSMGIVVTEAVANEVRQLRATGMSFVRIDARYGIHGKKGWWSWKICKGQ